MLYSLLQTPDLLFDNSELDIECLVKFHKSTHMVVKLLDAVFHAGEAILHVFYNRNDRCVIRLK